MEFETKIGDRWAKRPFLLLLFNIDKKEGVPIGEPPHRKHCFLIVLSQDLKVGHRVFADRTVTQPPAMPEVV